MLAEGYSSLCVCVRFKLLKQPLAESRPSSRDHSLVLGCAPRLALPGQATQVPQIKNNTVVNMWLCVEMYEIIDNT